ncbi:hypothetical protein CEXT_768281 [Caerostris extrusa]|uniref:Uncharacterized protein n=1 Tax=Caerostris extrusa TaxID=172846 RepID=A0AAV4NQ83_CAEEX|nr:hypothetical protein CEXT_768281 [Caerostris extrusa]
MSSCFMERLHYVPQGYRISPKRFHSNPVDERINNERSKTNGRLPYQNQPTIPPGKYPSNKDLNSLDKILCIAKEFSVLFQPLGGIDSLFNQLQSCSSQAQKIVLSYKV